MEELELGIGDTIRVYKANMIIPQIAENLTRSGHMPIPPVCPACGRPTVVRNENGVKTLFCENPDCGAKQIKLFAQLVSRNALNIEGLSEATLEKFIDRGFIRTPGDLFRLRSHEAEITTMEGFGRKSFENLVAATDMARETTLARVLFGIGIPGIGVAGGKLLESSFGGDLEALRNASEEELAAIENIGEVTARDIRAYFNDPLKKAFLEDLLSEITLVRENRTVSSTLEGKVFVVTGSVEQFKNRDELKEYIEARGGKVTGSVTSKTDYLINNDTLSNSTKNKTAKQLGIPIISEEEFLKLGGDR